MSSVHKCMQKTQAGKHVYFSEKRIVINLMILEISDMFSFLKLSPHRKPILQPVFDNHSSILQSLVLSVNSDVHKKRPQYPRNMPIRFRQNCNPVTDKEVNAILKGSFKHIDKSLKINLCFENKQICQQINLQSSAKRFEDSHGKFSQGVKGKVVQLFTNRYAT